MIGQSPTVCFIGPESTGKTTLARELASQLRATFVPEYGRYYCETFGSDCDADDLRAIVAGHRLLVDAARRRAQGALIILDTDEVMTAVWADVLLGARPHDLDRVDTPADLYLLTDVDVPFQSDAIRYFPDQTTRVRFFELCRSELERRGVPYAVIGGEDHAARRAAALAAIRARFAPAR
jgi:HTH-type transcriptional regulator, transcriptional repressor of NAD biosynthesis genes